MPHVQVLEQGKAKVPANVAAKPRPSRRSRPGRRQEGPPAKKRLNADRTPYARDGLLGLGACLRRRGAVVTSRASYVPAFFHGSIMRPGNSPHRQGVGVAGWVHASRSWRGDFVDCGSEGLLHRVRSCPKEFRNRRAPARDIASIKVLLRALPVARPTPIGVGTRSKSWRASWNSQPRRDPAVPSDEPHQTFRLKYRYPDLRRDVMRAHPPAS